MTKRKMHKLFYLKNFIFLLGLSFSFFLLFSVSVVKADFTSCGITQTDPIWEIKNSTGTRVLAIDSAGNMDIVSTNVNVGWPPASGLSDAFIIQRKSTGLKIFSFSTSNVYIPGSLTQNVSQATIDSVSGDDLLIKNLSGVNVARFDNTGGKIYIKGNVCGLANQISSCEQLQNIQNNLSADYVLTQNIDCSDTINWNGGLGFDPIGKSTTPTRFSGTLDGQGYEIQNLYINRPLESLVGLFGQVEQPAVIKNVGVTNINIAGDDSVGGLVGNLAHSIVDNSYSTGVVIGNGLGVGGLVGATYDSGPFTPFGTTISNSYSMVDVENNSFYTGGLVGDNRYSTIINSYATGDVSGANYAGGLVGYNREQSVVSGSYAIGNVSGTGIGGLIGNNNNSTIINSYATGVITSTTGGVGGLVGSNYASDISGSYFLGNINSGGSSVGGLIGYNNYYSTISDCYSSGNATGTASVGGLVGYNMSSSINSSYSVGTVSGGGRTGGLVGYNEDSAITGSYSASIVSGTSNVGGLVGESYDYSDIIKSYASGSVSGSGSNVGGLLGKNSWYSDILNSYSTGNVSGNSTVGGLLGHNYYRSNSSRSYSTGSVNGVSTVGGIAGKNDSLCIISYSYWNKETSGQVNACGSGTCTGATGESTTQMKKQGTFSGWDFVGTWNITINVTYPFLR